jgi:hypothetical protein
MCRRLGKLNRGFERCGCDPGSDRVDHEKDLLLQHLDILFPANFFQYFRPNGDADFA